MTERKTPDAAAVARAYFNAWNRHDLDALAALFAGGGTFQDPMTGPISGEALRKAFAGALQTFPDLSFEVLAVVGDAGGTAAAEWRMRGTSADAASAGRALDLPGTDFFTVEDRAIRSARAYFDVGKMLKQLGQA